MRSDEIPENSKHVKWERFALLKSVGVTREEFERPLVGIANTWNEAHPGTYHQRELVQRIKDGIRESGGTPFEFNTIALCDGLAQGHEGMKYILPHRDIIASSIEATVEANRFDALVCLGTCDKIVPGMVMSIARLDIPSIMVTGGYMLPGKFRGRTVLSSDATKKYGLMKDGVMERDDYIDMVGNCCPTPGACPGMWTANTMASISEALGISMKGNAAASAVSSKIKEISYKAGKLVMELFSEGLTASDILTGESLENAAKVLMATGGSTNATIHLPAIGNELGLKISKEFFKRCAEEIPTLCGVDPIGDYTMKDLDEAGGIPALMNEIEEDLNLNVRTVDAERLKDRLVGSTRTSQEVIRTRENPYYSEGAIAVLEGNLAPDGAVVKQSAVDEKMLVHEGPARVFEGEEAAFKALMNDEVEEGDVIVIRYEGPKGGPGMREMFDILQVIDGKGMSDSVPVVTDGRFSGSNRGGTIGHVSPEAFDGGPIAFVEDGDEIEINIPERRLEMNVSERELQRRKKGWKPPEMEETGLLFMYSKLASSPFEGAGMTFCNGLKS